MVEKRRYKKSEITRRKLIDAAVEVFAEKGYSKARITDITKKVGLTHAAFYAYFKDKDDLVRSLVEEVSQDLGGLFGGGKEAKALDFNDLKSLKKSIAELFGFYREKLPLHAAFIEGALQDGELRQMLWRLNRDLTSTIALRVKEGKKEGRCENWNPEVVGNMMVAVLGYLAVASEMGVIPQSKDAVVDNLAKVLHAAFS
jgi:AcrR family transcriptional regulator